jgi:hypothetical protein
LALPGVAMMLSAIALVPAMAHGQAPPPPLGATIYFNPVSSTVMIGGAPKVLEETVAGVPFDPGLGSFELDVSFDPNTIAMNIEEGDFLKSTGRATSCSITAVMETNVRYGCTSSGDQPGAWGGGVLARFTIYPAPGLQLRPTIGNGRLVVIDNLRSGTALYDVEQHFIPIGQILDAIIAVLALDGDLNQDCRVDIIDEQLISKSYGSFLGSLLYSFMYDVEPAPNGDWDVDIKDLQFVFGRDGNNCLTPQPTPPITVTPIVPTVLAVTRTPTPNATITVTRTVFATQSPQATQSVQATHSPTVTRSPQATPHPGGDHETATPERTTTPGRTPTSESTREATERSPEPTRVDTVLPGTRRPGSLPPTGSGGLSTMDWGWLISFVSLTVGILLVLLLRETIFGESNRNS